ncbi:DNA-binding response OmpR family regulator [Sphingomonas kyeonggiensis]|uniref:DNA-binding response OmpR family regulator n=1 Tax=Sphingomonas kyeonggiensis TaxID=1268553 RepID=A0A7W7K3A2_9SPHN|nr:response regulator transcription factor [Sphingomonas kyeonggiensis]MBB4839886.1 DNA-binding response OmpR family regulator [Sphingomonas kyeonggiensis]
MVAVKPGFPDQNGAMHIAVVDDDEEIIDFVSAALTAAGYACTPFRTGAALLAALRRQTFDLILLDWNLPDSLGIDLLRSIRGTGAHSTAIIMLTSRSDKDDIAVALQTGADDYVVKPESSIVIAARVGAVLRRALPDAAQQRVSIFGKYGFDRLTGHVRFEGADIPLSAKEFGLALLLFENMHRPLSRSYLLEKIWQSAGDLPTRTLDMHVSRIRAKLNLTPANGYRIVAISGFGYRMEQFGAEELQ